MNTYQKITGTLSQGAHPGSYNGQDAYNDMLVVETIGDKENDVLGRDGYQSDPDKQKCEWGGQRMPDKDNFNAVIDCKIVRRLTPLECERLQGYPDGWTDIGDWIDSNGKKRKTSDSARYKALGNSIALPYWQWMLGKMIRYCKDGTMASLFDGIGGFPLCWLRVGGVTLWASEIEEYPIAVTKYHFGEN